MGWPLQIPKILTDADWQKNKGKIAKIAGKTGVGEAMKELEKTHKAVDSAKFTAGGYGKLHTIAEVDEAQKQAIAYYKSAGKKAYDAAKEVAKVAEKTAADWKKKPLIPKDSRKHAEDVAKAAEAFAVALAPQSLGEEGKTFDEYRAKLQKQIDDAKKDLSAQMKNLKEAIDECRQNPTQAEYAKAGKSVYQKTRSIANYIMVVPEWKAKFWSDWKDLGNVGGSKAKDPETQKKEILALCDEREAMLKKLANGLRG